MQRALRLPGLAQIVFGAQQTVVTNPRLLRRVQISWPGGQQLPLTTLVGEQQTAPTQTWSAAQQPVPQSGWLPGQMGG